MTPFPELVGSVCAHTHTHCKMLTRSLEFKRLALHSCMQGGEKKPSLELGEKEQIEGVRIERNQTQQIGSCYLNTPSVEFRFCPKKRERLSHLSRRYVDPNDKS